MEPANRMGDGGDAMKLTARDAREKIRRQSRPAGLCAMFAMKPAGNPRGGATPPSPTARVDARFRKERTVRDAHDGANKPSRTARLDARFTTERTERDAHEGASKPSRTAALCATFTTERTERDAHEGASKPSRTAALCATFTTERTERDAHEGASKPSRTAALCATFTMKPFVSVIIPVRNECGFIGRALDSILLGDYPADRMEVIVADGMSTDGTRQRIAEYSARDRRVRMIDNPERITPTALNRAIDAAGGEIIARVDAHATVAPDYLSCCIHHLEWSGADNVGGPMRTLPQSSGPFSGAIVAALSHRFGVGNSYFRVASPETQQRARWVDTVFGGCWRREVFDTVGRFNERLVRSQDLEFSLRLKACGGKTLLAPDVRSEYYARSDFRSFWRHNFRNGEWAVLPFVNSEIVAVSVRHLVPLMFVAALALGTALVLGTSLALSRGATPFLDATLAPGVALSFAAVLARGATLFPAAALARGAAAAWTVVPLAMVAIPYILLNLAASTQVAWRERKLSFLASMPMVFASLHLSYGLGSASGVFQIVSQMIRRKLARRATMAGPKMAVPPTAAAAQKTAAAPNKMIAARPIEVIACLPRN